MLITKADGSEEEFIVSKLEGSLHRAGASKDEIARIVRDVEKELHRGMTTEAIYRRAFEMLRELPLPVAARYSLRRALFNLGPTGFPFEDFIAELLRADGYTAKTRTTLKGKCVEHEVDVVAHKDETCLIVEAKFHLQPGTKSDVQVALYSHARFLDIVAAERNGTTCPQTKAMIVTNTKFTSAAKQYATCVGIDLLSWEHPHEGNLHDWIERTKLYPITVLSKLNGHEKESLLSRGAVLCRDIVDNRDILSSAGIPANKITTILDESAQLCMPN